MIYIPCVKVHWSLKSNKVRTWFPKSTKLYITMVALISYAALNKALMDAVLTHNGTEAFWSRQWFFLSLNKNSFMSDMNGLTYIDLIIINVEYQIFVLLFPLHLRKTRTKKYSIRTYSTLNKLMRIQVEFSQAEQM